ncbi:pyridoxamine 5'-phosphate oxidase family protein [Neomegalonema perideroedes]|uniref:pyridoxamine 5'-phosphate oxidase family protein n=1 Tax=Neomegalonema perideroedes TaxID=217219 RepID=UPI00037680A8|nr:pyridoxamine 5'-phosphate oxidase family protein [Neomegalonema perideroedes]
MSKLYAEIAEPLRRLIERQKIFFTATAAAGTRVNISPRPTDLLRVIGPNRVIYLDLTGSGNETMAHLREDGRLTFMFCTFEGPPMILRLYGKGRSHQLGSPEFEALLAEHYEGRRPTGARQIVELEADLVQTSCGYGVPLFDYEGERPVLNDWAERKGEAGVREYQLQKNQISLDGRPTGLAAAS